MMARPPASAHSAVVRSKRAATVNTSTPTTGKTTPQRTTDPNSAMCTASRGGHGGHRLQRSSPPPQHRDR